jgi:hypothetical protein
MTVSPLNDKQATSKDPLFHSPEETKGFHGVGMKDSYTVVVGRTLVYHQSIGTVVSVLVSNLIRTIASVAELRWQ